MHCGLEVPLLVPISIGLDAPPDNGYSVYRNLPKFFELSTLQMPRPLEHDHRLAPLCSLPAMCPATRLQCPCRWGAEFQWKCRLRKSNTCMKQPAKQKPNSAIICMYPFALRQPSFPAKSINQTSKLHIVIDVGFWDSVFSVESLIVGCVNGFK